MLWLWLTWKQSSPIWAKPNKRKCWHSHQNFELVGWTTRLVWEFGEFVTAIYTKSWSNANRSWSDLMEISIWLSLTQVMNASLKTLEDSSKKASITVVIFLSTMFNETMSTIPCYVFTRRDGKCWPQIHCYWKKFTAQRWKSYPNGGGYRRSADFLYISVFFTHLTRELKYQFRFVLSYRYHYDYY